MQAIKLFGTIGAASMMLLAGLMAFVPSGSAALNLSLPDVEISTPDALAPFIGVEATGSRAWNDPNPPVDYSETKTYVIEDGRWLWDRIIPPSLLQ